MIIKLGRGAPLGCDIANRTPRLALGAGGAAMSAECSFMVTSKPPPERVSGDRRFGINAISANAMTNTALLEEIGPMLRGHYTALTEEPLPEYCLEIVERFATNPAEFQATGGADEASAAISAPTGRYLFNPA